MQTLENDKSKIDILAWAANNVDYLKDLLHQHGAILFKGFKLKEAEEFTNLAKTVCPILNTEYGDLTEENSEEGIYSSTAYPIEQPIHIHNESAQATQWPLYMFFCCENPALEGGTTQVVDTRKVLADLNPKLRKHLEENCLTYTRTHYPYVDTSWQKLYNTEDPRLVEKYCREAGVEFCWKQRDTLQTQVTLPPIISHPVTGEAVLFHQLFLFHPACLDGDTRLSLEKIYRPEDFPRFVTWGNGEWISDEIVQELFALYQKHRIDLQWQRGDILMLDNAIMAHGRSQFRGARKLLVAMGNMIAHTPVKTEIPLPECIPSKPDPTITLPNLHYCPVYQEFEAVALSAPNAHAICQGDKQWTYQQLREQAFQTVAALQDRGIEKGATVAVTGSRCFELIAAILGLWMNGQVIILLDPAFPEARKDIMLQESGAQLLLFTDEPPETLCHLPMLNLKTLPSSPTELLQLPEVEPEAPAYIFFTSGTTGYPKGIVGNHKGLAHFLHWQRDTFGISRGERIAQLTSLSFDVVLRDIFLPLISGATLCLPPETLDLTNPWQWFSQAQITRLHAVPTLATLWLEKAPKQISWNSLKTVFFAGEPLTDSLVNRWRSFVSAEGEIVNLYGPTETTLAKCWYKVPALPKPGVQSIGKPLPGTQILIINEQQELCGNGETGEIVIRTPYKTLGYLHKNSSQTSGFVPNPFHNNPGDILYYTGDLGRYNLEGNLEILGRKDDQIKIFGVRIEPQEIVSCLVGHPQVKQAFVTLHPEKAATLVAFVVADEQITPHSQLLSYLADRLQMTMIPHQFIYLEEMPLTTNGKIDRKALLKLLSVAKVHQTTTGLRLPTPTEEKLINIWQEIFPLDSITTQDDFFLIGGHSLLAMQVVARVREQFGVPLEIHHIFENPTVESLATYISSLAKTVPSQGLTVSPNPLRETFPLSFAQERLWFLSQMAPEKGVYNIPGAIRFQGIVEPNLLQTCIDALVERHPALRTCFVEELGVPQQIIQERANLVLEHLNLANVPSSEQPILLRQKAREITLLPFALNQAPLARIVLVQESERDYVLIYALHHTIADGWSNLIFNRELQQHYVAGLTGKSLSLPQLPLNYGDYALWEKQLFQEKTREQLNFWQKYLETAPPCLELPRKNQRPAVQTFNGASCALTLSETLANSIKQAFSENRATLFLKLLTVFKVLLAQYTGERDIVIGSPVARRHNPNYESVMGCFINTLAIRTKLPKDCTLTNLLEMIRSNMLEVFAHQDVPFDKVVESVNPPRNPSYHPIFQVLFNCLYFEEPVSNTEEICLQREWLVAPETKFDFTLYVREQKSQIHLHLVYNLDLFEPTTMEQLLAHYQLLLEEVIAHPNCQISALPLPQNLDKVKGVEPQKYPSEKPKPLEENAISATEISLAAIWRELLSVNKIGRNDNFFALGGYSLLAVRLMSRIREVFNLTIPLRSLFTHPTLAELSGYIEQCQHSYLPPILPGTHHILSIDQERLWQLHKSGRDKYYFNVPRAISLTGELNIALLSDAIKVVLERHTVLRSLYLEQGGTPTFKVLTVEKVPLEVVNLMTVTPAEKSRQQQQIIDGEASYQFDLSKELPIRLTLLQHSAQEHTLIVTAHHIAVDCWSLGLPFQAILDRDTPWHPGIFLTELLQVYQGMSKNLPFQLPPLPIQFSDFAHWQRQQILENRFQEVAAFWHNQLQDAPRKINLPTDFQRPSRYSLTGVRSEFTVPPELIVQLEQLRRRHRTTLFVPLLTAFALAIHQWSGESDIVVGTPVSNRNLPETQNLIGAIANTIVLRIKLDHTKSVAEMIEQVRHIAEQSFAHQEYPFTQLVRELKVESSSHPPLFQIRFVLQEAPEKAFDCSDLVVAPIKFDRGVSKYDLSLIMVTQGDKLRGWCEYNASLFKASTINAFTDLYLQTVRGLLQTLKIKETRQQQN